MQISATDDLYLVCVFPRFRLELPAPRSSIPWKRICTSPESPEDVPRRFALKLLPADVTDPAMHAALQAT